MALPSSAVDFQGHGVIAPITTTFSTTILTATPSISGPMTTASSNHSTSPELIDPLAEIQQLLSPFPPCVQSFASRGVTLSNCGPDAECICSHTSFVALLLAGMEESCGPADSENTVNYALQLCPKLNDSRALEIRAIMVIITCMAIVAVGLRIVSRKLGNVAFWFDDYLIVLAMAVAIGEAVNMLISISPFLGRPRGKAGITKGLIVNGITGSTVGLGTHVITLSPSHLTSFLKTFWLTQLLFAVAITLVKMSILCFYLRIFTCPRLHGIVYIVGCFTIAWFIAEFVAVMLSCVPLAYNWDRAIPKGHCIDENTLSYAITGISIAIDLVIFALPIPPLWNLKTSKLQRLSLVGLFTIGSLVCVSGIIRIPFLVELDVTDLSWTVVNAGLWIQVETKIGIVCACLPTLKPVFRATLGAIQTHMSKLNDSTMERSSHNTSSHGHVRLRDVKDEEANRGWCSAALSQIDKMVERAETKAPERSVQEIELEEK